MKKTFLAKANLTLVLIFFAPIFLFVIFRYRNSSAFSFLFVSLATLTYLLVALLHHLKDKTIKLEIILEYFLIALLALIIFQGLV